MRKQQPKISSSEQRKEEIRRIFENYENYKTSDSEKLPIFFGDTFRQDEIFLNADEIDKNQRTSKSNGQESKKNTNTSKEKSENSLKELSEKSKNNSSDRSKSDHFQEQSQNKDSKNQQKLKPEIISKKDEIQPNQKSNELGSLAHISEHSENVSEVDHVAENEALQEQLRLAVDHICYLNETMLQICQHLAHRESPELEQKYDFNEIMEQNKILIENLITFIGNLSKNEDEHDNQNSSQRKESSKKSSSEIKDNSKKNDSNSDRNTRNEKEKDNTSDSHFEDQHPNINPINVHVFKTQNADLKGKLFKILNNDLLNLKELKEKFFQVLLSIDRDIETANKPMADREEMRMIAQIKKMEEDMNNLKIELFQTKNEKEAIKNEFALLITEKVKNLSKISEFEAQIIQLKFQIDKLKNEKQQSNDSLVKLMEERKKIDIPALVLPEINQPKKAFENDDLLKVIENLSLVIISKVDLKGKIRRNGSSKKRYSEKNPRTKKFEYYSSLRKHYRLF